MDKVVLITGASSGIGQATAILLAKSGYKIAANYNNNLDGAQATKVAVENAGGQCTLLQADVTNKDQIEQMVDKTIQAYGKIDILVNNAGAAIKRSPFLEIEEELWDKTFQVNVTSMFLVSQAVLKHMVKQKSGKVINISSIAARRGGAGESVHYAAAKGAVNTLTVGMAKEFAPHGILINAIAPGFILTPFQEKYSSQARGKKLQKWWHS